MKHVVSLLDSVNFAPATVAEEVVQNVKCILATRVGTVPLHRNLGLSWQHIDKPLPVAKVLLHSEIIDAINEYEPRAKVESVEFDDDTAAAMEGILRPRVIISLGEDEIDDEAARTLRVAITAIPFGFGALTEGESSGQTVAFFDCGTATPIISSISHDCGSAFEMTDKILDCGRADSFAR